MLHLFVFMGSFLLFTMEPMIARIILPNFGGAFHVWSITMTFFQGTLFLGYAYCHYVAKSIGKFHFIFVLLALIWIPLHTIFPTSSGISPGHLVLKLIVNYSIPFGVLATTSVIAQSWFSYQNKNRKSPYQLYVSSNAGSLVALISYITIFEPMIGLQSQKIIWFGGFLFYVILAWKCQNQLKENNDQKTLNKNNKIDLKKAPIWLLLSALPSGFMLATTNAITLELGSMPLVWIIPLSIYLISFMLAFSDKFILSKRLLFFILPSALLFGLCSLYTISIGATWQLIAHIVALFFLSVTGHRELYNRRPEKENLTQFYLIISIGGWLGGIFVSFISPIIFNTLLEYPIIVALFLITISSGKFKHILKESKKSPLHSSLAIILFFLIPWRIGFEKIRISNNDVVYQKRNFYGIYRITDQPLLHYSVSLGFKDLVGQLIAEGIDVNSIYKDQTPLDIAIKNNQTEIADLLRNKEAETANDLLATSKTKTQVKENIKKDSQVETPMLRTLMHGSTNHGEQLKHPQGQRIATSYYHANGPLGKVFKNIPNEKKNVAIIGLGIGTCATYFSENDNLVFYELDQEVVNIAKSHFTFLENCKAELKIITGDARIKLNDAKNQIYDIIFVDAFSSDAIPSHLLTKEALDLYQTKLTPDGTIIFHISNRHYDIASVITSTALHKWDVYGFATPPDTLQAFQDFALFCAIRLKNSNSSDLINSGWRPMANYQYKSKPWSDDYINTLEPLYFKFIDK